LNKRVIITGANGFIGRHVAMAWHSAGADVCGLLRSPATLPFATAVTDLGDDVALNTLLRDADVVVHAAHTSSDGTQRLAESAARAGVKHFVQLSSVAVLQVGREPVVNDATPAKPTTTYGERKYQEESALTAVAAASDMKLTILRIPAVFGPGMTGRPLRLGRLTVRGWPIPDVGGKRSLVYVDNVAAATLSASAVTGTFLIEDGFIASPYEYATQLKEVLGERRPARVPFPTFALRAVGSVIGSIDTFMKDIIVDGSRFVRESRFQPPVHPQSALRTTALWLKAAN
jgi:UDP-glucose 4-epimerase